MAQTELPLGDVDTQDLLEHLDELDLPEHKWGSSLARMIDVLTAYYRRHGRSEEGAIDEAQQVVAVIAHDQGGRNLYLPRGNSLQAAMTARKIYLLHNGRNTEELAERFGMTVRHVQRIYAEQRALHIRKLQGSLFTD